MESNLLNKGNIIAPPGGDDNNAPFSFLEWRERQPLIREKDQTSLYNSYIKHWFEKNKQKSVSQKFVLRQKYLYLLTQLQLFFTEEEKTTWYSRINLADENELLQSIPYFAKKLKEVALYYLNLRKKIKKTKLLYNTIGTKTSIEQEVYRHILENYFQESPDLPFFLNNKVPSLTSLRENLSIQVEELYDDKQYFDNVSSQPLSAYYDILNEPTSQFFSTKGLTLSSAEELFKTFTIPDDLTFNSFVTNLTGNIFETTDYSTYISFVQKYLGEDKYIVTYTPQITSSSVFNIPVAQGNNYFYYPYGTTQNITDVGVTIVPVSLSSISIPGATAGTSLINSDKIFVKHGSTLKKAWLRYKQYEDYSRTVKTAIKKDTSTVFTWPFPGYGLVDESITTWTGRDFSYTPGYDFLDLKRRKAVDDFYWAAETSPVDRIEPLSLQNTSLIKSGATAHTKSDLADHFFIRTTKPVTSDVPFGELSGAWLYKFTKTNLPVTTETQETDLVTVWPMLAFNLLDQAGTTIPLQYTNFSYKDLCMPVSVNELDTSFFTAASSLEEADAIYKITDLFQGADDASEYIWLSGKTITTPSVEYVQQDGFCSLFPEGITRFIWTGPEVSLSSVFKTIEHSRDCPFSTNYAQLSSNLDWEQCTCKQVYHTPFGHSGDSFEKNNDFADFIIKDTQQDTSPLDLGSWRDENGNTAFNSLDFAWYKTKSSRGWGNGEWTSNITTSPTPFTLKTGSVYFYSRTKFRTGQLLEEMPPYSVKFKFGTKTTKWVHAKLTEEEEWNSSNIESERYLYPGDYLKFYRTPTTRAFKLSSQEVQDFSFNEGSIWATNDKVGYVCDQNNSTDISWPTDTTVKLNNNDPQYPPVPFSQITNIVGWTITRDSDGLSQTILDQPTVTFVPPSVGTFSVSVTATITAPVTSVTFTKEMSAEGLLFAVNNDLDQQNINFSVAGETVTFEFVPKDSTQLQSTIVLDTIIPKITAFDAIRKESVGLPFETPNSGFLLEQPLKGWNYNTAKPDRFANGAKPFWAVLYADFDSKTKYKSLYNWGYPDVHLDGYLPNQMPILSPIEIANGTVIDYNHKGYSFIWNEPIVYQSFIGQTIWSEISSSETSEDFADLRSIYSDKNNSDYMATIATTNPTDVILSNNLDGYPVEIYYYALQSFAWPITGYVVTQASTTEPVPYYRANAPWENLGNRFTPTVATVPVLDQLYSVDAVGGYFLPNRLGATMFVNKNYNTRIKDTSFFGDIIIEDYTKRVGGLGHTKANQPTFLDDPTEDNTWLKESTTAGKLAGAPRRSLTKTLQTFIPYQSNNENSALGLVTPLSRLTPWGGKNGQEWTDSKNDPQNTLGVKNPSAWAASQNLKYSQNEVDHLTSDIYGNQYGILKPIQPPSQFPISDYTESTGELWIRTNGQTVKPAYVLLSSVFEPFKVIDETIYRELTGNGITETHNYYNTMFIRTSGCALFAEIDYSYENDQITSTFDNTRYKLLNSDLKFERNWFFGSIKKVVSLYTQITGSSFFPIMYELDLTTTQHRKIFPDNPLTLTKSISTLDIQPNLLSRASLSYNKTSNSFLMTYKGTDTDNKMFVADFTVKYDDYPYVNHINLYRDLSEETAQEPPIVLNQYLTAIPVNLNNFTVQVSAINNPTNYELLNYNTQVSVITSDGYGVFTGSLEPGLHHINYSVSNQIGENVYSLTLSAI